MKDRIRNKFKVVGGGWFPLPQKIKIKIGLIWNRDYPLNPSCFDVYAYGHSVDYMIFHIVVSL